MAAQLVKKCASGDINQLNEDGTNTCIHNHEPNMLCTHGNNPFWSYDGDKGPINWGKLNPSFILCANGKRQSPVNIDSSIALTTTDPIVFDYTASPGWVVNNGHTVQANLFGQNQISVKNVTYKLVQFHFHIPSEEQLGGKRFPMVVHLVHRSESGAVAVVAVMLTVGKKNDLVQAIWGDNDLSAENDRFNVSSVNPSQILPSSRSYYMLTGSLTTPPCSENVLWMVMQTPVELSTYQLVQFQRLYVLNARPTQPLNDRK